MTTISTIITCANAGSDLIDAVQSVLNQEGEWVTRTEQEIIVVDNRSDDFETLSALEAVAALDPRVRVFTNTKPRPGRAGAFNMGLKQARGEWIAFLATSDSWPTDSLEQRLSALATFETGLVAGNYYLWPGRHSTLNHRLTFYDVIERTLPKQTLKPAFENNRPFLLAKPLRSCLDTGLCYLSTLIVHRALLDQIKGFDESLYAYEDLHLSWRLTRDHDLLFVPKPLAIQHHSADSDEFTPDDNTIWAVEACKRLLDDDGFAALRPLILQRLGRFYRDVIEYHRDQGERLAGMRAALQWVATTPITRSAWRSIVTAAIGR